ncbi:MAG TPA: AraC family transcriptional regulator [Hyphomonadaceae bacterium]|nr:AraC family transcriptional regulator [Hyphomonadaceae bacterium]
MERWVRAAVLSNYFEVARLAKLDPAPLLKQVQLSQFKLSDPDRKIPLRAALRLLEESAKASEYETYGLRMAQLRKLSDFGAVSLLLLHQPTLRAALTILQRYQYLLNQSLSIHVEEHGDVVVVREEFVAEYNAGARQGVELALGVLFRMCEALFAPHWRPMEVHLTHEPPAKLDLHRQVFASPLTFRAEFCGFVCPASDLDRLNARGNPEMARYAQHYLDSLPGSGAVPAHEQVRQALHHLIPSGHFAATDVARHLGIHVRSLQRRLEGEGASFLDLQHEARMELARRYLQNRDYSIIQVAELLGYTSPSAFTRWFTARFGMSPTVWRDLAVVDGTGISNRS